MGPIKTDAVVLRSIRYGEADRVLHLYTSEHGRVGAIAKGSRRPRSRFGGRLEPFFRLRLELHQGRSDLMTVTGAQTIAGHARLRMNGAALDIAVRACDAVGRMFETSEPHPAVFNLLCRELSLLDADPALATRAHALAFRLKLLVAAGLSPRLGECVACGEREELARFSGAGGGMVCGACQSLAGAARAGVPGGSFALGPAALAFMLAALARPLAEAPDADPAALGQAERAIAETLEHHAHVRLMPAGALR
ncbi:MAG: DNA repair protein RecO [Acidobacteriota bacterium]|nr:DNA repair protein RecO [Acidobacteriota bacterium]